MGEHITGIDGIVKVNATEICVTNWTLDIEAEEFDTTTTCSDGAADSITGITTGTGTVTGYWDTTQIWHDSPLNIKAGTEVTLQLYIDEDTAKFYQFTARVNKTSTTSNIKEITGISFDYKSTSTITYPV